MWCDYALREPIRFPSQSCPLRRQGRLLAGASRQPLELSPHHVGQRSKPVSNPDGSEQCTSYLHTICPTARTGAGVSSRSSELEPAVWLRVKCERQGWLAPVADLCVRRPPTVWAFSVLSVSP